VLELNLEESTVSAKQQRLAPGAGASGGARPSPTPMGSEVLSSTSAELILQRGADLGFIQTPRATITILTKH